MCSEKNRLIFRVLTNNLERESMEKKIYALGEIEK